jgi:hypothetical protein
LAGIIRWLSLRPSRNVTGRHRLKESDDVGRSLAIAG